MLMVSRLLLVLLILTGLIPVRICTFAASTPHPVPNPVEKSTDQAGEKPRCGCRSKSKPIDNRIRQSVVAQTPCEAEQGLLSHDRDCPAAKPLTSGDPAVSPATPETLTALDLVQPQWNSPYSRSAISTAFPPIFRIHVDPLPRYLAFLTLLI